MILQLGVKPSWFNTSGTAIDKRPHLIPGTASSTVDLRNYMIDIPSIGDSVVPEMLLKVLELYRIEGWPLPSALTSSRCLVELDGYFPSISRLYT